MPLFPHASSWGAAWLSTGTILLSPLLEILKKGEHIVLQGVTNPIMTLEGVRTVKRTFCHDSRCPYSDSNREPFE
jgi:hypothetical protein